MARYTRDEAQRWLEHLMDVTVDNDAIIQRYNETSQQYDEFIAALNYSGAKETGRTLAQLFPENREKVKILDIAAGTGLCAVEFSKHGFQMMDALEPSQDMLQEAKKRGLYVRYINDILGNNTLDIPDDTYDVVTMSSFPVDIMRKLPMKSFEEIIRVIKPGGYFINTGFYTSFVDGEKSTEEFRQKMKLLEKNGKWKQASVRLFVQYVMDRDGGVSVHRIS